MGGYLESVELVRVEVGQRDGRFVFERSFADRNVYVGFDVEVDKSVKIAGIFCYGIPGGGCLSRFVACQPYVFRCRNAFAYNGEVINQLSVFTGIYLHE